MHIEQYVEVLKTFIKSDVPLHVWGSGGIGKSQVTELVTESLGFFLVDLRLATQEVGDLIGVPHNIERKITKVVGLDVKGNSIVEEVTTHETSWSPPGWFNDILEKQAEGIDTVIFMDEMDRAPKEVIQAVYQLCTKKMLHQHKLPSGTRIVAAGNPPTDEYMVDTFDHAMMTRWGHVYLECSEKTWVDQFGPKCDPEISGFIATHKGKLMHKSAAWDVATVQKPTPRGWEFVNRIYTTLSKESSLDKMLLQVCVGAVVGGIAAQEFVLSLDKDWVKIEDILTGKTSVKDIRDSSDANIKMLRLANDITQYMSIDDVVKDSMSKDTVAKRKENLTKFLSELVDERKELVIAAAKIIATRDKELFRIFIGKDAKLSSCVKELSGLMRKSIGY